jgi:hypothetical protein
MNRKQIVRRPRGLSPDQSTRVLVTQVFQFQAISFRMSGLAGKPATGQRSTKGASN